MTAVPSIAAPEARAPMSADGLLLAPPETRPRPAARLAPLPGPGFGRAAPDRLALAATAYLLLPALLFLAGWAEPWAAALAAAAAAAAFALAPGRVAGWPLGLRTGLACLALGLAWALPIGAHHLVYSTADWQVRDAVLRDLALLPWPIAYGGEGEEAVLLLRAPLGFFLPAGLVGRGCGPETAQQVAQGALWAWCGLGLGIVLALLAALARSLAPGRPRRAFAILAGIFVLFHGLDILPNLVLDGRAGAGLLAAWGRGGEWWDRLFQYSGHVTGLLWAPNHALPAWIAALLLLRHGLHPAAMRAAGLPLAAAAFWSPLGAAGAAALLGIVLVVRPALLRAALVSPGNWLAAGFMLPLALYLTAGTAGVPHGPVWALHPPAEALGRWALFLAIEVLPWALPVALLLRGGRVLFGAALALLGLLPAYVFGPGNEMASRGGMAPLAVLAVMAGAALLVPAAGAGRQAARAALLLVVVLAAAGAATEASLLLAHPPWPSSRACAVPEAARQSVFHGSTDWSHYLVPWPDPALGPWMAMPRPQALPPPAAAPRCWQRGSAASR